jgi:hypothetical protein
VQSHWSEAGVNNQRDKKKTRAKTIHSNDVTYTVRFTAGDASNSRTAMLLETGDFGYGHSDADAYAELVEKIVRAKVATAQRRKAKI